MDGMFNSAVNFNQPLNSWDTSKVTNMNSMFANASIFNQDLSTWIVTGVTNASNMFLNSALSTYNYNAILSSRSKQQRLHQLVLFGASPTQYGGCEVNAQEGIAGHDAFTSVHTRIITDGGLAPCAMMATGSITYSTSSPTSGTVTATLNFSTTGITITNTGFTPCQGGASEVLSGTCTFTGNGSFTFTFQDTYGNTGSATATVFRIDERLGFRPFITTRRTTSANEQIKIPTAGTGYDFEIDRGDGTTGHHSGTNPNPTHTYTMAGDYVASIRGDLPQFYMNGDIAYKNKLLSVDQWGDIVRRSMRGAFVGCQNLQI